MSIAACPFRRLAAVLILALLVRSLVVPGYMPAGGELVTLCTYGGSIQVLVDPETGRFLDESPHSDDGDCPWAGVGAPAAPAVGAVAFGPPAPASVARQWSARSGFSRSSVRQHTARGPPPG